MNPMQMMSPMMGGNPLMMLLQAMRSGGSPMSLMERMAAQNPQAAQAMKLIRGKSPQQLRETARNMAQQRGTSLEEIARQLGLTLPKE